MNGNSVRAPLARRIALLCGLLLLTACGGIRPEVAAPDTVSGVDMQRRAYAMAEVAQLRSAGRRVWCVPFARNASGISIRGNAADWWGKAQGEFNRGHVPEIGAVMVFSSTRKLPLGHVAVVSQVVSDREILIDHANWEKNKVSLGMRVIDVSEKGDWSAVRVESNPGQMGRVYPISGFIFPNA